MKGFTRILLYLYAAICLVGGVIATYKVHSRISLVASFFLAIFVLYGTFLWEKKQNTLLLSLVFTLANLFFLLRFCYKMTFFPSAFMLVLGILCVVALRHSPSRQKFFI